MMKSEKSILAAKEQLESQLHYLSFIPKNCDESIIKIKAKLDFIDWLFKPEMKIG